MNETAEWVKMQALNRERMREVFGRGISIDTDALKEAGVAEPPSRSQPLPSFLPDLSPGTMELHLEGVRRAEAAHRDAHKGAPTQEENTANIEAMQSAVASQYAGKPVEMDEMALRSALRVAIAAHADKQQRLSQAEAVLANSQTHIDGINIELRSYADLDERVSQAIANELRDRGRADIPYVLQQEQRQWTTASDRLESLTKAHVLLNAEVANIRTEANATHQHMRACADAVLVCHAQFIAQQVQEAEALVVQGRQQLAALKAMQVDLSAYVHHVLTRPATVPDASAVLAQWNDMRAKLCADADAFVLIELCTDADAQVAS
jgi:hypothetical protein